MSISSGSQLSQHGRNISVQGQMNGCRKCVTYTQWNITQPIKEPKMPCAATCKELETVILSEVSQKKKEQYHMILEPKKMMQIVIYKTESQV